MEAKDIIKELDPEYERCRWCGRLLHKSKLRKVPMDRDSRSLFLSCFDAKECEKTIQHKNES